MTTKASPGVVLGVALAALALTACDRATTDQAKRDAATAGQKVDQALDRAGEKIADVGRKAVTEVKQGAAEVRKATVEVGTSEPGRTLSDSAITASIKTDFLKDPDLSVLKIDVDTKDGVVTLNGLAGTEEGRKRAGQLAGAIKGVKEVRNHLTVKKA